MYLEFVLSKVNLKAQRSFSDTWKYGYDYIEPSILTNNKSDSNTNVCFWTSNYMDGQKQIWFQEIEWFAKTDTGIRFTWILNEKNDSIVPLSAKLRHYKDNGMLYNLVI